MEIIIRRNDLVKELQLVQGIVERKNSIPILSNVLAEAKGSEVRISATDLDVSLRCGCAAQVVKHMRVLVPRKAITELGRLLEGEDSVTFQQVESHLVFSVGGRTLASKLVEAQFPAFEKVIAASGDKTVNLGREALQSAIRRVSLLSSERSRAVKLTLATGRLELAASSPDLGEARESIAVDFKGEAVEIGFNPPYLVDFLGVAGTDTVALSLKDGETQGLLRPVGADETDYRYIVMPMRF